MKREVSGGVIRTNGLLRALFRFERSETGGERLQVRAIELLMAGQIIWHAWEWAFYLPLLQQVLNPTGIAVWVGLEWLFDPAMARMNALLITVAILGGCMGRGRYFYLMALILFHLQYAARFSQGAIGHGTNLTGMVLLSFVLADLFFGEGSERRRAAFGFMIFFAGLAYVAAGLSKLIGSGPNWPAGEHLWLWMGERSVDRLSQHGEFFFNPFQEILLSSWWLSASLLLFGLLTELVGFLLWFPRTRPVQASLLIGMHVGILWVMNIWFGPYIFILILIGYPWAEWADRVLPDRYLQRFTSPDYGR